MAHTVKKCFRHGRGFDRIITRGERQGLARWHHAIFGVAAAIGKCADPVTNLEITDAFTKCNDFSGDFKAENRACVFWCGVIALTLRHIRPVYAGSLHLHQQFSSFG